MWDVHVSSYRYHLNHDSVLTSVLCSLLHPVCVRQALLKELNLPL